MGGVLPGTNGHIRHTSVVIEVLLKRAFQVQRLLILPMHARQRRDLP